MKAVTLRGIPPGVARALRKRSEGRGESLNKAVLALLEEAVGSRKPRRKKLHHDLDALAGSWARDEGAAFERSLAEQRRIDPELWR
jgi:hypothetical protein